MNSARQKINYVINLLYVILNRVSLFLSVGKPIEVEIKNIALYKLIQQQIHNNVFNIESIVLTSYSKGLVKKIDDIIFNHSYYLFNYFDVLYDKMLLDENGYTDFAEDVLQILIVQADSLKYIVVIKKTKSSNSHLLYSIELLKDIKYFDINIITKYHKISW